MTGRRRLVALIIDAIAVVAVGVAVVGSVLDRHDEARMTRPSGAFPSPSPYQLNHTRARG